MNLFKRMVLVVASQLCTQTFAEVPEPPLAERYALAGRFLQQNADLYLHNSLVVPNWLDAEDAFWYRRTDAVGRHQFMLVDATKGTKVPAFDHAAVTTALLAVGQAGSAGELPFETFNYADGRTAITFTVDGQRYQCRVNLPQCAKRESLVVLGDQEILSPDAKWVAFLFDHNIWLRPASGGPSFMLTIDGAEFRGYGTSQGQNTHFIADRKQGINQGPLLSWSPDSRHILTSLIDERSLRDVTLTESSPSGMHGPRYWHYRTAMGHDQYEDWPTSMPVIIDVVSRKVIPVKLPAVHDDLEPTIEIQFVWWSLSGDRVYFIVRDPYFKGIHLHRIDPETGQATLLISERAKTFVHIAEDGGWPKARTTSTEDIIWYSERDGYGHLYRYNSDGRLQCQMTAGNWMVREIVRVDEMSRRVFFLGSGRDSPDPYYQSLYSVDFDCKNLQLLTPQPMHHQILTTPRQREHYSIGRGIAPVTPTESLSASSRYFVDNFSTPSHSGGSVLRRSDGSLVMELEKTDYSRLSSGGFILPEEFSVLARDGKTRLFGTLYRPSHFDPSRRYALIDSVYLGPQAYRVGKVFNWALYDDNGQPTQALAELGFIVITLDSRGSPGRSKADYNFSYGQNYSGSGNLVDHVDAIRSLAAARPYIDVKRVGVIGISSGGYAAARAMLLYPDLFKVGISMSGAHAPNSYHPWDTTYIGPDLTPQQKDYLSNATLADRLQGKLLIMHGEMDDNVHPFISLQFVDALLKNNKDFDFLLLPGVGHSVGDSGVAVKRAWDYMIKNLRSEQTVPFVIPDNVAN